MGVKYYSIFFFVFLFLTFFLSTACDLISKKPEKKYSAEQISRGEVLVMEGRCNFCHTPSIEYGEDKVSDTSRMLSGHPSDYKLPEIPNAPLRSQQWFEYMSNLDSTVWVNEEGIVFSANITPDEETGIGSWTEKEFIITIRTGKHPGWKRDLKKPMPWLDYSKLSNDELISIYAYLNSIKPVKNKVPESISFK